MKNIINRRNFLQLSGLSFIAVILSSCPQGKEPLSNQKIATLKLIGLFPMTGPGASLGEYLYNGVELAIEDTKKYFQNKLSVESETIDSKNQPAAGISALQAALAKNRPDALISGLSSVSKAIIPIVEQQGITTIVTTTALSNLPQGTNNVVRVYPTSDDFVEPVAKYMIAKFNKMAILYINDDFGKRNQEVFISLIKASNKNLTSSESFELTQTESRSLIAKVLSTSPDAIFVTGYGPAFINIFKQLKEAKKDIPIFSEIGFANPTVLNALGNDADGIIFAGTEMELSEPTLPSVIKFKSAYKSRFGQDPYQVAGFAYDSVMLLAEAFKKNNFEKLNKTSIISLSPFDGVMGTINFDSEGESRIKLKVMKRENGKTILI